MNENLLKPKLPIDSGKTWVKVVAIIFLVIIPFLPWTVFTVGTGLVTAIDPNERIQTLAAPVNGFIRSWAVKEGTFVKKGDLIADMADNDPSLLDRYNIESEAAKSALQSAELMYETSKLNLERQKKLFEQGLSARKEYEKAKIETSKLSMEYQKALSTMTKAQTQVSRQSTQRILAPRDGLITRIIPGERGLLIKAGTPIAVLTPKIETTAVELWIDGNDSAMVTKGQKAMIQLEGWPSLQVAGWPSLAIGTFEARVFIVDAASSYKGKFRVLLVPHGNWPRYPFLRPGSHVRGYIALSDSFVLKEVWRQLTGFPAVMDPMYDELNQLLKPKASEEEKK